MSITIEKTHKSLKAHLVLSAFLFWFALLSWFLPYGHSAEIAGMPWSAALMMVGAAWYMGSRVAVWWEHG